MRLRKGQTLIHEESGLFGRVESISFLGEVTLSVPSDEDDGRLVLEDLSGWSPVTYGNPIQFTDLVEGLIHA